MPAQTMNDVDLHSLNQSAAPQDKVNVYCSQKEKLLLLEH